MSVNLEELKQKFKQVNKNDLCKLAIFLEKTINFIENKGALDQSTSGQVEEGIQFDDEYLQQSFLTNLNNQINGVINGYINVDFALGEFTKIKEILDEVIDDLDKFKINEKFLGPKINPNEINEINEIVNSLKNQKKNDDIDFLEK